MTLYGSSRAALLDDAATAERLGWTRRKRSVRDPEVILEPRDGDARREPWIVPPWWAPSGRSRRARGDAMRAATWRYLPSAPGVVRYLDRLAQPAVTGGLSVALAGMGRVGGVAATVLAATPCRLSGVRELLIYDVDSANQERWLLELGAIAQWRGSEELPRIRPTTPAQLFRECDALLFAATTGVPPLGTEGDVRLVQLAPNRALLAGLLEHARAASFTGLFLVVSDPVDWLAQAAFRDSNSDAAGRFIGDGLAPERIAGLGLGVMWARALAEARREGWERSVARRGGVFGPHSTEVLVFDDLVKPSPSRSDSLERAARECNFYVRNLGFLPFVGPGVSSVALALGALTTGEPLLASVLDGGIYFGCEARHEWGIYPAPRRLGAAVRTAVDELHRGQVERGRALGLLWDN